MTRATVGGINSEDNLWYPLAVNKQGVAQIDTSGIPEPLEWKSETFLPVYGSTDESFSALIEYERQYGRIWWLGNMGFVKIVLRTKNVVVTSARGALVVNGVPYNFNRNISYGAYTGTSVSTFSGWNNGIDMRSPWYQGGAFDFRLQKFANGQLMDLGAGDFTEGSDDVCNGLNFSYWGELSNVPGSRTPELISDLLDEKLEIEADTP